METKVISEELTKEELIAKVEKLKARVKEQEKDIYELLEDYVNDTPISESRVYKKYLD